MTGRGWAMLSAAAVALVAGRLLGLEDLYLIGAGLFLVLVVASIYVYVARPDLSATRRVLPARVHAGTSSRVELALLNRARRRSPVVTVRDPFDRGSRWARFLVAPLAPGEVARAAYRLPTDRRGVFDLGPLEVSLTDPFGLASITIPAAPQTKLTVFPRIDRVAPPPGGGDDPLAGADHPRALTGGGEDFYALRPYVRGDDLRKVHWPSTARVGDLMLRQDEMPWQGRSTILLDARPTTCSPAGFEVLVSAAASVVVAANRHESLLRVVTTAGFDSRSGPRAEAILEHLAGVRLGDGTWAAALGAIRRSHGGGALVAMTTTAAAANDLQAVAALRSRFGNVTLVVVEERTGVALPPLKGVSVVRVSAEHPFPEAWSAVAGSR